MATRKTHAINYSMRNNYERDSKKKSHIITKTTKKNQLPMMFRSRPPEAQLQVDVLVFLLLVIVAHVAPFVRRHWAGT
jgi:hypothetical protein